METQHLAVKLTLDDASVRATLEELSATLEAAIRVADGVVDYLDRLALRPSELVQLKADPLPAPSTNEIRLTLELTDRALGLVAALRTGNCDRGTLEQARHEPSSVGESAPVHSEPR